MRRVISTHIQTTKASIAGPAFQTVSVLHAKKWIPRLPVDRTHLHMFTSMTKQKERKIHRIDVLFNS